MPSKTAKQRVKRSKQHYFFVIRPYEQEEIKQAFFVKKYRGKMNHCIRKAITGHLNMGTSDHYMEVYLQFNKRVSEMQVKKIYPEADFSNKFDAVAMGKVMVPQDFETYHEWKCKGYGTKGELRVRVRHEIKKRLEEKEDEAVTCITTIKICEE